MADQFEFQGHIVTEARDGETAHLAVQPVTDNEQHWSEVAPEAGLLSVGGQYTKMVNKPNETGLIPPLPPNPQVLRGRAPVYFEPTGYVEVNTNSITDRYETAVRPLKQNYVSDDQFNKFADTFKREDGRFVAMTAYGAVPVPEELMADVPERFVTKPRYEEKETFVIKKKRHDRITEKYFTQHQHHFVETIKTGTVDKIVPAGQERVVTIPRYIYKAVIAENVVEVPQGTKYLETPIDVHMKMPPKIVPVRKAMIVQRNIECTRPVVQERIIEVPRIVKKQVPKMVTKEIPFVVPKYVEKVIEVPFRPNMQLPEPTGHIIEDIPEMPEGEFQMNAPPAGLYMPHMDVHNPSPLPSPEQPAAPYGWTPANAPSGPGLNQTPNYQTSPGQPPSIFLPPTAQGVAQASPNMVVGGSEGGARIEGDTVYFDASGAAGPQSIYVPPNVKNIKLPYEAAIDVSVVQCQDQMHGLAQMHQGFGQAQPGMAAGGFVPGPLQQPGGAPSPGGHLTYHPHPREAGRPMPGTQSPGSYSAMMAHVDAELGQVHNGVADPRAVRLLNKGRAGVRQGARVAGGGAMDCCTNMCGDGETETPAMSGRDPHAVYAGEAEPIIVHDAPGMRNVAYRPTLGEPRVLTKSGVRQLSKLHCMTVGDPANQLFPPLSESGPVPMDPITGLPDLVELERIQDDYRSKMNVSIGEALERKANEDASNKKR